MNASLAQTLLFKSLPQFFSLILHPLLMPSIGVFIILFAGTHASFLPSEAKTLIMWIVIVSTLVLPLTFVPIYQFRKIIESPYMATNSERIVPMLVTAILYFMAYYVLKRWGVPVLIQSFILASALAIFLTLLLTLKWKISAHTVGIGGLIGLIWCLSILYRIDMIFYLLLSILTGGIVGFSRLSLNTHTPVEVYSGLMLGFGVMVGVLWWL